MKSKTYTIVPKDAPLMTPSVEGAARALRSAVWNTHPFNASAAPTRGTSRTCQNVMEIPLVTSPPVIQFTIPAMLPCI